MKSPVISEYFTEQDKEDFLFGGHKSLYDKCGAHLCELDGQTGVYFCVWAPNAKKVSVIGSFNQWDTKKHELSKITDHGLMFQGFVPGVKSGDLYKFHIHTADGQTIDKIDPFARFFEVPPKSASVVYESSYTWGDEKWINNRKKHSFQSQPLSIYELHIGSWKKKNEFKYDSFYTYRALAEELIPYLKDMAFTHIELMPVVEHPYFPSWGYHGLGYFAPSARYGTPDDFKYFIDACHKEGIGVIMDWVPSHFPMDEHGLIRYDGTNLYESEEVHPDWGSCIFNLGKNAVVSFLLSNAFYWCKEFHIDGIRVDAVASMLYLDYSRGPKEWKPNIFGGKENLESIAFLRRLNIELKETMPDVMVIAEESSAWPKVSDRAKSGGLNFDMKWNMGWMHDILEYFSFSEKKRKAHSEKLTWSFSYMESEHFILSLSHDEVVHGKSSLLGKMYGGEKEKFANLRCLFGFMYAHPGKKLLFMGNELAGWDEWNQDKSLPWELLQYDLHCGVQSWVKDLNHVYLKEAALYQCDFDHDGFGFIAHEIQDGVICFFRQGRSSSDCILIVGNFGAKALAEYKIGVPYEGKWKEILNSNHTKYSAQERDLELRELVTVDMPWQNQPSYCEFTLAPNSIAYFKYQS